MRKKLIIMIGALATSLISIAQGGPDMVPPGYDPNSYKIIPDKVFEMGLPLLLLFMLLNVLVTILKNRAEHQLKLKMIEKGVSEDTLINIFRESNAMTKLQPLKWFLFCFATAIAFLIIHLNKAYLYSQSGYLAVGIILICISVALFLYYRILSSKV